ncbi:hypothetical protein BofuT4_P044700.1 [Botrytis cinerea T4]|uniref:Uncharacterized protein n=1 Tax=Botryotinia fuckeliana (strain T4) TaxID=999810 RepID=G2XYB5_BOTF4|nr:hypothetical protein BofuT4_P044700.1 [Botrytis cinerea T4]
MQYEASIERISRKCLLRFDRIDRLHECVRKLNLSLSLL